MVLHLLIGILLFAVNPDQSITVSGTMHRSNIEGGCWYRQADGGKKFELIGDSGIVRPLHIENEHVTLRAEPVTAAASTCMIGATLRVLQRIDTIRYPIDPAITSMMLDGTMHRTKTGAWYLKTATGRKYTFQKGPVAKYRHTGLSVHEKFRIQLNRTTDPNTLDGIILSSATITKQKTYDSR